MSRARVGAAAVLIALALPSCSGINSQTDAAPAPAPIPPPTADAAVRKDALVPGRPGRVFVLAGFDEKCQSVDEPKITITTQPAKGAISFVHGQETTIGSSAQGTCVGATVTGTGIYYTPRAGEKGSDRFTISARLASGETATRSFEVQIAE